MAGVTVGKYAIVGAAAVVTHDVGEYEVVAGNPAKVIRTLDAERFEQN
jgi:acetyltransferase-like isoleucine patch superfamily enzyme